MDRYSATEELLSLPRNYTLKDAIKNNDIIYSPAGNQNAKRFFQFLINIQQGISDRIRITTFGIDGPAVVSIFEFKNSKLILTIDSTRYEANNTIDIFEGNVITVQLIKNTNNEFIYIYYLDTYNNKSYDVFKYIIK